MSNNIMNPTKINFSSLIENEVYKYYDGPLLFSCYDNNGNMYYASVIDRDDQSQVSTWYYTWVSQTRHLLIKSGEMPLNVLLKNPEKGFIYQVVKSYGTEDILEVEVLTPADIPDENVREDDNRLNLGTAIISGPPVDIHELEVAFHRRMLEIVLMPNEDSKSPFVEAKDLGSLLTAAQDSLLALALAEEGKDKQRGRYSSSLTEKGLVGVAGAVGGSLRIQLASIEEIDMFEESSLDRPFEIFGSWVSRSADEWLQVFRKDSLTHDVKTKYQKFLQAAGKNSTTNIQIRWTRPNDKTIGESRILTPNEAKYTAELFDIKVSNNDEQVIITGELKTIDTFTGGFTFVFEENGTQRTIRGKAHKPSLLEHKETTKFYKFIMIKTVERVTSTSEDSETYLLMDMEDAASLD